MQGTFDITCRRLADGTTSIGHQAVSTPWHLSKPYWDGHILLVQAANSTAGIFAGDHLSLNVKVTEGASVLLTSPSASRIHTMNDGEATLRQTISVEKDGWLEWMPELFIPQRNCRYRQSTEIFVADGASAYLVETLAPGRVAHGEQFAFAHVEWSTRIHHGNKLILAERYPLSPTNDSLADLTRNGKARYFANALLIHPGSDNLKEWQSRLQDIKSPTDMMGATMIDENAYLFRLLCDDSEQLKTLLSKLRAMLSNYFPLLKQSARKL